MSDTSYIARTSGLKFKDYLGYAMVDTAGCLIFSLVTTLLQKFYTDIFHLSPLFIMLMFIGARIWDAINDPIMGRICDTVKPGRFGRYRQWLLYAALPLALSGVLMFVRFPGLGEEGNLIRTCVYATVTYVFFGMAYTVLQIPYGSLASVVTTDAHERSKLSVWRSIGAALGSVPVMLIASFAYAKRLDENGNVVLGENGRAITDMQYAPVIRGVIAMALCSLVLLLIAFALNQERVKTKPRAPEKGAAVKAMKLLFQNRAFVAVSMASMLLLAGQMFTQSFYTYAGADVLPAQSGKKAGQEGDLRRRDLCGGPGESGAVFPPGNGSGRADVGVPGAVLCVRLRTDHPGDAALGHGDRRHRRSGGQHGKPGRRHRLFGFQLLPEAGSGTLRGVRQRGAASDALSI